MAERVSLNGDDNDAVRTALEFETGSEGHRWLNRLVAVGVGRRTAAGMVTDVFAVK